MIPYQPPQHTHLDILLQDESLLIVNKPAGLLSVPGKGEEKQDCLLSRVQKEYPEALMVHRLDMATSGLMILARNKQSQRSLSILFQDRLVSKTYIAVVAGALQSGWGEINLPLITDWPNRPRQKVDFIAGKPSVTRYQQMENQPVENTSRVALFPVTGRSHQLRVHLQAIGHPIIGDELYGNHTHKPVSPRLLLHAHELNFIHPESGKKIQVISEVPF